MGMMSVPRVPRPGIRVSAVCLVAIALVGAGPFMLANDPTGPTIEDPTLAGDGYIESQHDILEDDPGKEFVWRTGGMNVSANASAGEQGGNFTYCVTTYTEDGERANVSDCTEATLEDGETKTLTASLPDWGDDAEGNHSIMLEFSVLDDGERDTVSERAIQVYVLDRDGDLTGDGLTNEEEVAHGTNFLVPDTIGNGLTDWEEIHKYGTDPHALDTTGDGIEDATLVRFGLDPTEPYLVHRYAAALVLAMTGIAIGVAVVRRGLGDGAVSLPGRSLVTRHESAVEDRTGPSSETAELDASILTTEEYINRLLRRHGDRMRQRQIVAETDWSKAKVSRVLSDLEDAGEIRKIKVGRENVIERVED